MSIFSLNELVSFSKEWSPYYSKMYRAVSDHFVLSDLPLIESSEFWSLNTLSNNHVLTNKQNSGIVFKSGGTTGNPKFSFFELSEWNQFTAAFGWGMKQGGLSAGERIANLFYAGDLYASFLFIMKSIELSEVPVTHLPLSGGADFNHIVQTLNDFKVSTWAGVPTSIMKLAEYSESNFIVEPKKILFGGESLYQDQEDYLKDRFPNTKIQSIGYASVDGGLLGYVDETCGIQEHRVFGDHTIMEILDEDTAEVIHQEDKPGKLYLTNLTRKLMPIIRYPVGDLAVWKEPLGKNKNRKFKILGRTEEGARVGPATVYYEDIYALLGHFKNHFHLKGLQLAINHFSGKDELELNLVVQDGHSLVVDQIKNKIYTDRSMLDDLVRKNLIHPIKINLVDMSHLETNPRTGKTKRVIDRRGNKTI